MALDELVHDSCCLIDVVRQETLVVGDMGLQDRLVTKKHAEEFQCRHVPAQDHQAGGERSGQDQTDRSPQPGPEGGGNKQGHSRDTDAMPEQPWFYHVPGNKLQYDEQTQRKQGLRPPRQHDDAPEDRQGRGCPTADVGNVAQGPGQKSP